MICFKQVFLILTHLETCIIKMTPQLKHLLHTTDIGSLPSAADSQTFAHDQVSLGNFLVTTRSDLPGLGSLTFGITRQSFIVHSLNNREVAPLL